MKTTTKWAVICRAETGKMTYIAGDNGSVRWTSSRADADKTAADVGGRVVDAEAFARDPDAFLGGDRKTT